MSEAVVRWSARASASSASHNSESSRIERAVVVISTTIDDVETVRYTYRLRPGKRALMALAEEWDRCRWVWNQCVGRDREIVAEGGRTPSGYNLCAELTDWRGRKEWLRAGSQNAQQNTVLNWHRARRAAVQVKGRGRPKFKSRKVARPSLEYSVRGYAIRAGRLVLAGGVSLSVVWHRSLPNTPGNLCVFRDAAGDWWASFVVRREAEVFPAATASIGIDWGVKVTATATDPSFDLPHAEHGKTAARRLAAYQRRMARRAPKPGRTASSGYRAAKRDAAKAHRKVARQRQHDARQWARRVVSAHDLIAVEDFKPKFLARSTMARKAADASIGAAKRTLTEYAERAGRTIVLVPPAYTTMTCGECGARAKRLPLAERTFRCEPCGHTADRDRNAARVILASAELLRAGVESVSHGPPSGVSRCLSLIAVSS